jgi:serpin B
MRLLDFISYPEDSRVKINNWVSDQTEKKIQDLLPPKSIDELTRLVLTNAVYFNAAWAHQFRKEQTSAGVFAIRPGKTVPVPMMSTTENFMYASDQDMEAVELPYEGRQLAMTIVVPVAGRFSSVEDSLTPQRLSSILSGMRSEEVRLSMPRFKYDSGSMSLKDMLAQLGMTDAFDSGSADFSGIDGGRNLFIGNVIHKGYVSVDEAGTEAAAATAVILPLRGMYKSTDVTIDRPFLFFIRDLPTGAILFIGRVTDPTR